jgi:hypothetical protein
MEGGGRRGEERKKLKQQSERKAEILGRNRIDLIFIRIPKSGIQGDSLCKHGTDQPHV